MGWEQCWGCCGHGRPGFWGQRGPADRAHVPRELQGMSAACNVLWPQYVSAVPAFEQSSFASHLSDYAWKICRSRDRIDAPAHLWTAPPLTMLVWKSAEYSGQHFSTKLCPKPWAASAGGSPRKTGGDEPAVAIQDPRSTLLHGAVLSVPRPSSKPLTPCLILSISFLLTLSPYNYLFSPA